MPLTTALFTGLTGMNANSRMIDVTGNNIANVNTTAFKRSRVTFETQIGQTLKNGSAPTAELGGTNPAQVGMGVRLSSISRDFSSGGFVATGVATDMAIEGNGFFIVSEGGSQAFTRSGNFTLDRDFNLVTTNGSIVQGYGVDEDFNIVDGLLQNVNIPLGVLTIAEATNEVKFAGNLNAGGESATQGSIVESEALYSDALATTFADDTTALSSLYDADGNQLFAVGDLVTITGMSKGGAVLADTTFEVGAADTLGADAFGTTVDDFMQFFNEVLGLDETADPTVGVSIDPATGVITFQGNSGEANDIVMEDGNIVVNQETAPVVPMQLSKVQEADGESARTTFMIYDTLGNPLNVDLTMVLEDKTNTGTTWRFYAQSTDDTDLDRVLGTGVLNFDTDGQLISTIDSSFTIDRTGTGAFSPQAIQMGFEDQFGSVTALYDVNSQISSISQDGSPLGTLEDFSVSENGEIVGVFSNSLLRTLGQIPLAMFANNGGLVEVGGSQFKPTVNSGIATVVTATSGGSGKVIGRATELSNVELSEEFINLISASTGFSANSRIITTSERLIQELLSAIR